jgi:hypothetical protein
MKSAFVRNVARRSSIRDELSNSTGFVGMGPLGSTRNPGTLVSWRTS